MGEGGVGLPPAGRAAASAPPSWQRHPRRSRLNPRAPTTTVLVVAHRKHCRTDAVRPHTRRIICGCVRHVMDNAPGIVAGCFRLGRCLSPNTFGTGGELVRNWRGFIALLFGTGAKLVRNWRGSIASLCGTGTQLLRRARPPPDFGQQLARGLAAANAAVKRHQTRKASEG
jgi:hypothetical protein